MTLFWVVFVFIVAWSLGRAQLRAEISDRAIEKRRPTDTNEYLKRRRGY